MNKLIKKNDTFEYFGKLKFSFYEEETTENNYSRILGGITSCHTYAHFKTIQIVDIDDLL